jgi:hypothetical protein
VHHTIGDNYLLKRAVMKVGKNNNKQAYAGTVE